jgi:type I restriction enzyme S subunit
MAGNAWTRMRLGEFIKLQRGHDLPDERRRPGKVPIHGSFGITGWHDEAKAPGPGITVGRSGASFGTVSYSPVDFWPLNTALYVVDFHGNDERFAYYFLKYFDFQIYNSGSAQPSLNRNFIHPIPVAVPPLSEQRAIADILGTLDDKIELNRRMNETLEGIARAIFKSWFVDFNQVRAKAEGRDTGMPKHIADLFPDSFVDSELGEIPKGWTVGRLGNVLQQRVERCAPSSETAAQPYVPIDCISSKSLFLTESKPGLEAQSSLTRFYKGDLLFGAMRPYFHKVCIAPFTGTTRTTAFVLYPVVRDDFSFATLILHNTDTIDYATRHSTGSTIPYAVWPSSLQDMPISLPLVKVRSAYDRVVRPILDRIPERYFEHRTLTDIRDTLLPKLISGELRIKNAEKFLEKRL